MEVLDDEKLFKDDGVEILITQMNKYLGKDELQDAWDRFQSFDTYLKADSETWLDYINNFDSKYERIKNKGITLPSSILAFKLLNGARLSEDERLVIMTGMNFTQKDKLYEDAVSSLKKFKCGTASGGASNDSYGMNIKAEPTYYTSGGRNTRSGYGSYRNRSNYRETQKSGIYTGGSEFNQQRRSTNQKDVNPMSKSGQILRCHQCDSYRHLGFKCPSETTVNPTNKENGQPMRCLCCDSIRHLLDKCPHSWEVGRY